MNTMSDSDAEQIEFYCDSKYGSLKKILLGDVCTAEQLEESTQSKLPNSIKKVLKETKEDLSEIKKFLESRDIAVSRPVIRDHKADVNVRDFYVVCDDTVYVSHNSYMFENIFDGGQKIKSLPVQGSYSPNVLVAPQFAVLNALPEQSYRLLREELRGTKKILTNFVEGHADGVYTQLQSHLWLADGDLSVPFLKHLPDHKLIDLQNLKNNRINDWSNLAKFMNERRELKKTKGKYFILGTTMDEDTVGFVDRYLKHWVGYCEESLFDVNLVMLDEHNAMVISQNSEVYSVMQDRGINCHQVPWRHRWFWDGGLHCITNDIVRVSQKF